MKKAQDIEIRDYQANIEVFASRDDDDGTWEGSGRILNIPCSADDIPSASHIPTIRELHADAEGLLTLDQCREIKTAIRRHVAAWL